jgi:hypothetical protein
MTIDVEIGGLTVTPSSNDVGQFAESRQVISCVKGKSIVEGQAVARLNAFCNGIQVIVV